MPKKQGNPAEAFESLLDKNNKDAHAVALKLFGENYEYREEIRELKDKSLKEGDIVLSGDDAKEYQAFKALNVKADDVKKAIDAVPTLEKQNKELSGMENLREIADLGLDGSKLKLSVLKDQLIRFPDAEIAIKTEKDKDGNEAKVAYVKKDKDSKEQSFTEFANENLADYLPSLKVSAEATSQPLTGNFGNPQPRQQPNGLFDRIRESVTAESKDKSAAPGLEQRLGMKAA
jgi:hypothetical protein